MKSLRLALLAAGAALVLAPAAAFADPGDHGHDRAPGMNRGGPARADGGWRGGDHQRPTPPQASSAPSQAGGAPHGDWHDGGNRLGGQPGVQRGGWQGWRGDRNSGRPGDQAPGGSRPDQRGFPQLGHHDRDGRPDGQHWNDGGRHWNDNGRRWDDHGRHWDNGARHWDNGARRWDNGARRWGNEPGRWGGPAFDRGWRSDRRYDWHGWRDSHRDLFRGRYRAPYGWRDGYRSVGRGFFLEPFFYGSNYWLDDPYAYRLPPVSWPMQWVRYYDDALLVDVTTGEVIDVIQGFFFQ